jgi:hypothetical protein
MTLTRRSLARFVLGAPVAAAASVTSLAALFGQRPAAAAQAADDQPPTEPEPTPLARFLAKQETDLSGEERARIKKKVTELEQSLQEIRAFTLGNDVPPSGTFRALRSKR